MVKRNPNCIGTPFASVSGGKKHGATAPLASVNGGELNHLLGGERRLP
jgi:hypothetical protein